jgi:hypothetical protein
MKHCPSRQTGAVEVKIHIENTDIGCRKVIKLIILSLYFLGKKNFMNSTVGPRNGLYMETSVCTKHRTPVFHPATSHFTHQTLPFRDGRNYRVIR